MPHLDGWQHLVVMMLVGVVERVPSFHQAEGTSRLQRGVGCKALRVPSWEGGGFSTWALDRGWAAAPPGFSWLLERCDVTCQHPVMFAVTFFSFVDLHLPRNAQPGSDHPQVLNPGWPSLLSHQGWKMRRVSISLPWAGQ